MPVLCSPHSRACFYLSSHTFQAASHSGKDKMHNKVVYCTSYWSPGHRRAKPTSPGKRRKIPKVCRALQSPPAPQPAINQVTLWGTPPSCPQLCAEAAAPAQHTLKRTAFNRAEKRKFVSFVFKYKIPWQICFIALQQKPRFYERSLDNWALSGSETPKQ